VVLVSSGTAAQYGTGTLSSGLVTEVADVRSPHLSGSAVSRGGDRPALQSLADPAVAAGPLRVFGPVVPTAAATSSSPVADLTNDQVAIARAVRIGAAGGWAHLCLAFVRTMFGLPVREPTAVAAWNSAQYRHPADVDPPAGVPVFWSGGVTGAGHVAVSLGGGWIISTDLPAAGYVSEVPLSWVQAQWGLTYLGWTEDLEGVRVDQSAQRT
jgi:hypothetical protein